MSSSSSPPPSAPASLEPQRPAVKHARERMWHRTQVLQYHREHESKRQQRKQRKQHEEIWVTQRTL